MFTTPPQAIAPGSPVALKTPTDQPYEWVVISNLSPYLLSVQAGITGTSWMEPFTAMLFPTGSTHAPVSVQAQRLAGTLAPSTSGGAQVQATWYTAGEKPVGTWPVSLTAQAVVQSIAGAGIAGASNLSAQVLGGAAHGTSTNFNTLVAGTYRLWGWGWFPPSFIASDPTKGVVQIEFGNGGQGGAWDQLSYVEAASDRLNGLVFGITNTIGILVSNYFDQDVDIFVNLSPA